MTSPGSSSPATRPSATRLRRRCSRSPSGSTRSTEFATLDAVSNGRAQLIVSRGSLTDSFPPHVELYKRALGREGRRPLFQDEVANGSLYVGSPATVATRLAAAIRALGLSRFDLAYAVGQVPHSQRMATIELYGREVIPRVRELLAVVQALAEHRSGTDACLAAGVTAAELPAYARALETLARSGMIAERRTGEPE